MTICSKSVSEKKSGKDEGITEEEAAKLGIVPGHAYGILKAEWLTGSDDEDYEVIQIRNPHAQTEWTGKWSDKSDIWTDEAKEQVGWTDEDDGKFWMDFKDAKKYFDCVDICRYQKAEGNQYSF
jgi:hypothetical protein